jgi:heme O synthase-like polyprenyltransferase
MIKGTAHEATLILHFILLLLEGGSLFCLVVILVLLAFTLFMRLRLVHNVGTSLTLNSFRSSIFSLCFLLNIKRHNQV